MNEAVWDVKTSAHDRGKLYLLNSVLSVRLKFVFRRVQLKIE